MDERTARALAALNRRFYEESGDAFGATRRRGWRGWERILSRLPVARPLRVLDLGCGNGRLLGFLREAGIEIDYLGLDASEAMLEQARGAYRGEHARFAAASLHEIGMGTRELPDQRFDLVAIFGLMHHLPARQRRSAFLRRARARAAPGALLAISWWRFQRDARFAERCIEWMDPELAADPEIAGIDTSELEDGDTLLRFGERPGVPRYCHFADDAEIAALLCELTTGGARLLERFDDDGEGRQLNDYALLRVEETAQ